MASSGKRRARGEGSRVSTRKGEAGPRVNIYDEVTQRIIAELEAGRFPWVQPWDSRVTGGPGLPMNALTGRRYSGINVLLLWGAAIGGAYPSQHWLTFKQALESGGNVRKGEKGTMVVYADRFVPEAEKTKARETGEDAKAVPFLKRFTVFNVAQCEGLRPETLTGLARDPAPLPTREIIPHAEALIEATGADFRIGGSEAFYSPGGDFVAVPPQPAFRDQINFYRTAFHELSHWTGHAKRLGRDQSGRFGSKPYAREELCAEISAAFICAALGIVPTVRHADYVGSWLEVLREDNRAIFRAASHASKAADFILAFGDAEDSHTTGTERRAAA
ncbi:antirepressor [Croceicoccus estronivorus]|uniref:ArdC family protein n=1 Tax=Croceicoccus estronivorus TaxID=1172626 RepID=UPI000833423D|nr:zincin-like metallopeptidase domain-containing protein [Croceicoccus estronivorus]OCC24627.1 antirepressor [Croceicoccus estronivorus]